MSKSKSIIRCIEPIGNFKKDDYYIAYNNITQYIDGQKVQFYRINWSSSVKIKSTESSSDVVDDYFTEEVFRKHFRFVTPNICKGATLKCKTFTTFWNNSFFAMFKENEMYEVIDVSDDGCVLIDAYSEKSFIPMISIVHNFERFNFIDICFAKETVAFDIGVINDDNPKTIVFRKDHTYKFKEVKNGNVKVFTNEKYIIIPKDIFNLYFN